MRRVPLNRVKDHPWQESIRVETVCLSGREIVSSRFLFDGRNSEIGFPLLIVRGLRRGRNSVNSPTEQGDNSTLLRVFATPSLYNLAFCYWIRPETKIKIFSPQEKKAYLSHLCFGARSDVGEEVLWRTPGVFRSVQPDSAAIRE